MVGIRRVNGAYHHGARYLFREHVEQMSRNGRTSNVVVEKRLTIPFVDRSLVPLLSEVEVSSRLVFCHVEPRTRIPDQE